MLPRLLLILLLVMVVVVIYGRMMGRRDGEARVTGLTGPARDDISTAIRGGDKILAIKLYRQATNAALVDAKRAVDTWFVPGVGEGALPQASADPVAGGTGLGLGDGRLTAEARSRISALVSAGRREDAMALYAEATGASDSEAQAIIRTWDPRNDF